MIHALSTLLVAATAPVAQDVAPRPLPPLEAQPPGVLAVAGGTIHPADGPPVPGGVMLVEGGRITALGPDVAVPDAARVVDATGMHVVPGLVESHAHTGFKQLWRGETTGSNNNDLSKPVIAEVRAVDGLNAADLGFALALRAGVTTVNVMTGSRSFASGQAVVLKMRGRTVEEMAVAPGGLKFAMRIRSRNQWDMPVTEIRQLLAERLREAQAYLDARGAFEAGEREEPPPVDLQLEALGRALTGEWPVHVHAHGVEPMSEAIALADDFGLRVVLHHAESTVDLVDELASRSIPISFGPVLPFMGRDAAELQGPVRLAELGGLVALHQDHPDGPQYYLRHGAGLLVRAGMPEEDALRTVTLNPARILGLDERIGSLTPGKDADFVLLDGPPLEWESRVHRVFIEGVEAWRLDGGDASAPAGRDGEGRP
ncbi:MAG TPA: amidohydrolase family protein [Longimicrobiales bacterium]|nr:amidohydrolase family protein [Longimicrobiales bacterium]